MKGESLAVGSLVAVLFVRAVSGQIHERAADVGCGRVNARTETARVVRDEGCGWQRPGRTMALVVDGCGVGMELCCSGVVWMGW